MEYAIDLNARQSARTIGQAVRYQATALIEPGMWPDTDGLKGRLVALGPDTVRVEITEPPILTPDAAVGNFCDVTLLLGNDRFVFNTHAVSAERAGANWHLDLARPAKLQVCQRRRFWRVNLAESSQVQLRWEQGGADGRDGRDGCDGCEDCEGRVTGSLCNISGEGLACLVEADAASDLLIGETVSTSFELPGCSERFELDAVLCNKTPTARQDRLIIGMQFLEPASLGMSGPARRLNEFLVQRYGSGVAPVGGGVRAADGVAS
jgi:hypothetical protein